MSKAKTEKPAPAESKVYFVQKVMKGDTPRKE